MHPLSLRVLAPREASYASLTKRTAVRGFPPLRQVPYLRNPLRGNGKQATGTETDTVNWTHRLRREVACGGTLREVSLRSSTPLLSKLPYGNAKSVACFSDRGVRERGIKEVRFHIKFALYFIHIPNLLQGILTQL
jgi:hypothetical protein